MPDGRLHCASARSPRMDRPPSSAWRDVVRSASSVASRRTSGRSRARVPAAPCASTSRWHSRRSWNGWHIRRDPRPLCLRRGSPGSPKQGERVPHTFRIPTLAPLRSPRVRAFSHFSKRRQVTLPVPLRRIPDARSRPCHPEGTSTGLDHSSRTARCLSGGPAPRRPRNQRGHAWPLGRSPLRDRRSFPSTGKAGHCDSRSSSGERSAGSGARRRAEGT